LANTRMKVMVVRIRLCIPFPSGPRNCDNKMAIRRLITALSDLVPNVLRIDPNKE